MHKASVLMPAYNDARYIRDAVDSILSQTVTDFELVIVNDGSTDETLDILQSYTDKRIKIINHPHNLGRACARNTALKSAQGEYAFWMDADDISLPRRLERQIAFMDAHPEVSVVGGYVQCFHGSDKLLTFDQKDKDIKTNLLFASTIPNPASCLRLSTIRQLGVAYDPALRRAQDYDFWCQLLLDHKAKAANIPETLLLYRVTIFTDRTYHTEVQRRILKRLDIDADADILQKCFNLGINQHNSTLLNDLEAYHTIALRIIVANKKYHVFDQSKLELRINSRLAALIMRSQDARGFFSQFRTLTNALGYKNTAICGANFFRKTFKKYLCRILNEK